MSTATPTKPKLTPARALAEFTKRGEKWAEAKRVHNELARELADKLTASRQLHDQRQALFHYEPELFDHHNHPVSDDNAAAAIDRDLEALGDLSELQAKVDHAARLAESAKQAQGDYAGAHFAAIVEGRRSEAEAVKEAVARDTATALTSAAAYLDFIRWSEGVCTFSGRSPRLVAGLESAGELLRVLEGWDRLPVPLPEMPS
jgi:hypothetical protein